LLWFLRALKTFWCAILGWIYIFRMNNYYCSLNIYLCSWYTWTNKDRIGFSFLGFESRMVCFEVGLAILCYTSMIFYFMRTIVFLVFGTMWATSKHYMFLLLAIFALENTWVCISVSDSNNLITYIKTSVNKAFYF